MIRVLFVCLGNICRSPSAEGVFRDMLKREGLDGKDRPIDVDSAGTAHWHVGKPPD
ncbi:MAG TPA: low molecular weight phosphotyrosine protein phosphatase, partial [Alphaproteobacteria bacterium]|nr:low molecular weight phosphotyrosine protein phosphatase [Alphaproteobacteria bacterium]